MSCAFWGEGVDEWSVEAGLVEGENNGRGKKEYKNERGRGIASKTMLVESENMEIFGE